MNAVIVSRHPAAIEFIARKLGGFRAAPGLTDGPDGPPVIVPGDTEEIPVRADVTPDDVRGRIVYGNLPLALAALAAEVRAVEFEGTPPRGREYTMEDMKAAGAVLRRYRVETVTETC